MRSRYPRNESKNRLNFVQAKHTYRLAGRKPHLIRARRLQLLMINQYYLKRSAQDVFRLPFRQFSVHTHTVFISKHPSYFTTLTCTLSYSYKKYKWKANLVYMDDIVIFSKYFEEHIDHVDEILTTLCEALLTLNLKNGRGRIALPYYQSCATVNWPIQHKKIHGS